MQPPFPKITLACQGRSFDAPRLLRQLQGSGRSVVTNVFNHEFGSFASAGRSSEECVSNFCHTWATKGTSESLLFVIEAAGQYDSKFATFVATQTKLLLDEYIDKGDVATPAERSNIEEFRSLVQSHIARCSLGAECPLHDGRVLVKETRSAGIIRGGFFPKDVSNFFPRTDLEHKLRCAIGQLCDGPSGALIVHGTGGIGKTTTVGHLLNSKESLSFIPLEHETYIFWLNVCGMTNFDGSTRPFDDKAFCGAIYQLLLSLKLVEPLSSQITTLALQGTFTQLGKLGMRFIFIFDDTFQKGLLYTMSFLSQDCLIHCIALTRNSSKAAIDCDTFKCQLFSMDYLSDVSMEMMLAQHYGLKEKGLDDDQIKRLGKLTHGLVLIGSVINSHFANFAKLRKGSQLVQDKFYSLANRIDELTKSQVFKAIEANSSQSQQMTLSTLMTMSPEFESPEFLADYYTFLIFPPGHNVETVDLQTLWQCTADEVEFRCQTAVEASLLRIQTADETASSSLTSYVVHDLLWKATMQKLLSEKKYPLQSKDSELKVQRELVTDLLQEGGPACFASAIETNRVKLLDFMFTQCESEFLVNLALDSSKGRHTTALHLLAQRAAAADWVRGEGRPSETRLSVEWLCRLVERVVSKQGEEVTKQVFNENSGNSIWDMVVANLQRQAANQNGKLCESLIFVAAKLNCHQFVKLVLTNEAIKQLAANGRDRLGNNALIIAADNNAVKTIEVILTTKGFFIDVNGARKQGETAIMVATRSSNCLQIVKTIFEKAGNNNQVNVNQTDRTGRTVLHWAAEFGRLELVKYLVEERQADVAIIRNNGWTAAEVAVSLNVHFDVGRFLIEHGSGVSQNGFELAVANCKKLQNIEFEEFLNKHKQRAETNWFDKKNKKTGKSEKPMNTSKRLGEWGRLHEAAQKGQMTDEQYDEVILEIENENIDMAEARGITALHVACYFGRDGYVEVLLKHGAGIDVQNNYGYTGLISACQEGHSNVVEVLLKHGAGVDIQSNIGYTGLIMACFKGHSDVVEVLLKHGAGVDIQNNDATTALMISSQNGHFYVVKLLLKHHADVYLKHSTGRTAIMFAASFGHSEIVASLLCHGAAVDGPDYQGDSLFAMAKRGRCSKHVLDMISGYKNNTLAESLVIILGFCLIFLWQHRKSII